MKDLLLALLLLVALPLAAVADAVGQWRLYPAYTVATRAVAAGSRLYVLTSGNLMRYDTDDESVRTYDALHDLNDVSIAYIGYSQEAHRLIIVYADGNIDLLDDDDQVLNIPFLRDKVMSQKNVRSLYVHGPRAYLATDFGFMVIDLREGVISQTYQLGRYVSALCIAQGNYYLSMSDGTYALPLDANPYDAAQRKKVSSAGNIKCLAELEGKIFGLHGSGLVRTDKGFVKNGKYTFFDQQPDGTILFGNATEVNRVNDDLTIETFALTNTIASLTTLGKNLWAADGLNGLRNYRLDGNTLTPAGQKIQPNSPVRDLFFRMAYVGDRLLVAGGEPSYFGTNRDATAMMYEAGEWTNFSEDFGEHPFKTNNFTHIAQDPQDPSHHFVGSFRKGLYEFRDGRCVKIYNSDNSPIRSILPNNADYYNYCGAMGVQYDQDGRLWMLNNETDTIIRLIDTNGRWRALYYPEIEGTQTPTDFLFTRTGVAFVISRRVGGRGFFGFYTGGTLTTTRDDNHTLRTTIVNEDNTSYTPDEFYAMAEDLDGQVWCGTNLGLFVIQDPTRYFDKDFRFEQIKIARDDGSGLADYLLSGVSITAIAVDGGNRKWIGTVSNGIYLVSPDGQEMIHHFQAADSPLPSDFVQSIAIHPTTGLVMIGTDKGLCSFMADAAGAEPDLDFNNIKVYPNPVSPDYHGPVTVDGLTLGAEVKICSSAGQLIAAGTANGGRFVWDGLTHDGRRPASGVYQIIANTAEGKKAVVARIVVIK